MSKISMDLKMEKKLIRDAQKGGLKGSYAFGEIYRHYQPHIQRFFSSRLGGNPEAEDLTSEVFKKAIQGVDSFRWQGLSLSAWLYRISHNVLIDYFRESHRHRGLDIETTTPPKSSEPEPDETYAAEERRDLLQQLLRELPERERTILYLKFFEGRTNRVIAERLHLSETNVGTILWRALRKLREKD